MEPGQSVSPGGVQDNPTWQFKPDAQAQPPQATEPAPAAAPTSPASSPAPAPANASSASVNWTASEFIAHNKSAGWYGLLALAAIVVAAIVFLLTNDPVSTGVIIVVAILFGISAARKPRELEYEVSNKGVRIGDKPYPYAGFRSFAVIQEDGVESIWFMPLKRFKPIVSIYFDPDDGDKIADILSQYLPFENRGIDPVDKLMHRLRF